jgi:hypothetical protein
MIPPKSIIVFSVIKPRRNVVSEPRTGYPWDRVGHVGEKLTETGKRKKRKQKKCF